MEDPSLIQKGSVEKYGLPGFTDTESKFQDRPVRAPSYDIDVKYTGAHSTRSLIGDFEVRYTDPWVHPGLRRHTQEELLSPNNFQPQSSVDVLIVSEENSQLDFRLGQNDAQIEAVLDSLGSNSEHPALLALCVKLEPDDVSLFDFRVSMAKPLTEKVFRQFDIHSGFLLDLLGRPNYWSSVSQWKRDEMEGKSAFEFFCQHPRWHQRGRYDKGRQHATKGNRAPCSVYMNHSPSKNLTLYIIAAADDGEWFSFVDRIQLGHYEKDGPKLTPQDVAGSPFMVHALLNSIAWESSTDYTAEIRNRLMGQLRKINFDDDPGNGIPTRAVNTLRAMEARLELEGLTIHLNQVSQMINTGLSSVFSSIQLSDRMLAAHKMFCERNHTLASGNIVDRTHGMMRYLLDAFYCQQNYLNGYNLRKETAMNFVFHIVTQQDSATNLDMASSMSKDSSSMNTITIVTMLFLPGTFAATLFSSVAFRASDSGRVEITDYLWPFLAVSIVLTVTVIGFWYWKVLGRRNARLKLNSIESV